MNGSGIFNAQILVDKLAKLNSSQQSIETLSHWCIFHMKKAKQVVDTWERQFHCSPRDQRLSFLYLANDILQNSRRKGLEFVNEFWKVLPNALNDVVHNGDESARKNALRLVDIFEDRKVFGSRGQTLKEEVMGNRNRMGINITHKLKLPAGSDMLEKLIAGYHQVNDSLVQEDVVFGKYTAAISFIEKLEKEYGPEFNLEPEVLKELQAHQSFLRESIEQGKSEISSRATLISHLREAIHEQELKAERVHNQLQITQSRLEQIDHLLNGQTVLPLPDQPLNEPSPPPPPPPPPPPSSFSEIPPPPDYPPDSPTYEPARSLTKEDYSPRGGKRLRLDSDSLDSAPCYVPQPPSFPHPDSLQPPSFPHLDSLQPPMPPSFPHLDPLQPPMPPPMPFLLPPFPPPPLPPSAAAGIPFSYGSTMPYPMMGMPPLPPLPPPPPPPPIPYSFQGSDDTTARFGQPPPLPMISAPPPLPQQ